MIRKRKKTARPSLRFEIINEAWRKYPDGREVCLDTGRGCTEYTHRTVLMVVRQKNMCADCGKFMFSTDATFDHEIPRGLGGAFRDDRIEIDGTPVNRAVHFWCNSKRGSKRLNKE